MAKKIGTKRKSQNVIANNPDEIGGALGLSKSDTGLMKIKAELSEIARTSIRNTGMTVSELVKLSGVARSKVSAIKNGATVSVSCDLLVKIISVAGMNVHIDSV